MMIADDFSKNADITCEKIFSAAMTDERATETCKTNNYNFSDPDVVSFFVRGPWYNNVNQSTIMSYSGMTDAEYWAFYDVNNTSVYGFGSYLNIELTQIV